MAELALKLKKELSGVVYIIVVSVLLFVVLAWCDHFLYRIFSSNFFLTWHIFLELSSIVMSFAVFAVTFYTFEESNRLRSMIIACTFLAVSLLDLFHTLSYKGMPVFLTESSAEKATAFWTLARLTMSCGMLASNLVPCDKKVRSCEGLWVLSTIAYSIFWLMVVNYRIDYLPSLFIEGKGLTPLKVYLEYLTILIQLITAVLFLAAYIKGDCEDKGYALIVKGLVFSVFSEMAFTQYTNVYDTYNFLGHIYKIIAYYLLFRALFVQNVQKPYQELRAAESQLGVYVNNLEQLVAQRTAEITAANQSLMKNLEYARNILLALLPNTFPSVKGVKFAARYMPCENVGGDFYNIFRLDDEKIGILIGDVAGHGVSAAMINVFINQNINFKKEYDDGRQKVFTPRGVLMNCYHTYNEMPFPDEAYVVMLYGIYNVVTRKFTYASAGMNTNPLVIRADGQVEVLQADGFPICKFAPYFKPSYKSRTVHLEPGDSLVFYTDGLIEIDPAQPELFSQDKLVEFVKGLKDASAQEICDEIIDAYHALLGDKKMLDDVTVLVVKACKDDV
ncbi:SpoIIE family protein phosphatase [Caldicoprobacter algeriensis]|uniref:MASE3 domain-containing protein n=1 Tax=Caldicoprobacter algeriensis TaxID=699281 RepID=UPI002079280F|nr:MASE3 domain-containing protein [Caldicoprobacter algeriensis]MCM8900019.1 SpoIIE family protein phosphatase [Caldicoprobacter algeriensis]